MLYLIENSRIIAYAILRNESVRKKDNDYFIIYTHLIIVDRAVICRKSLYSYIVQDSAFKSLSFRLNLIVQNATSFMMPT